MPLVRLFTILVACAVPVPASAQEWARAYQAGDYVRAADLLHDHVVEVALTSLVDNDPAPARHLALMYANGLGVERDRIAACSLAQFADMAAQNVTLPGGLPDPVAAYRRMVQENERFVSQHCALLSDEQRRTAIGAMGCFAFGMPEQEIVAGRQSVRIGRRGVSLVNAGDMSVAAATDLLFCPMAIAGVRVTSLDPPPDAAPGVTTRHFVEVFGWHRHLSNAGDRPRYWLGWTAYEIRAGTIALVAMGEQLGASDQWPRPGLPADLDARLSLQMIRSGHVRWVIAGDPPRRGWIMLDEETDR